MLGKNSQRPVNVTVLASGDKAKKKVTKEQLVASMNPYTSDLKKLRTKEEHDQNEVMDRIKRMREQGEKLKEQLAKEQHEIVVCEEKYMDFGSLDSEFVIPTVKTYAPNNKITDISHFTQGLLDENIFTKKPSKKKKKVLIN